MFTGVLPRRTLVSGGLLAFAFTGLLAVGGCHHDHDDHREATGWRNDDGHYREAAERDRHAEWERDHDRFNDRPRY